MNSIILTTATRLIVALLIVFSLFMLLRGHNEPGGGFIGGLIGATGFVLYAIACGTGEARRALRAAPENVAVAGLGIALLGGLMAGLFGDPLFTGQWLFIGATETSKGLPLSSVLASAVRGWRAVLGEILVLVSARSFEV